MMKNKCVLPVFMGTFFSVMLLVKPAYSVGSPLSLSIEPIIGYERTQKLLPTAHTKDRMIYGARVSAGLPLISAELEYTRGQDSEDFPTLNHSIKDTDDKLKLGARSSIGLSSLFSIIGRGGVQAKRNVHEETLNGVTTKTTNPITYKPYAGLGLTAGLGRKLMLTGGITTVFNDFPNMSKNEYETTLGFTVRLP